MSGTAGAGPGSSASSNGISHQFFFAGCGCFSGSGTGGAAAGDRTDRDVSVMAILLGTIVLIARALRSDVEPTAHGTGFGRHTFVVQMPQDGRNNYITY